MALSSVLLILALLIFVALFLARPLIKGSQHNEIAAVEESSMLAERERIIEALLELDFDQRLGKVPEEIYAVQRHNLLQQGAKILQILENENTLEPSSEIETDDDLEALIAARKAARS